VRPLRSIPITAAGALVAALLAARPSAAQQVVATAPPPAVPGEAPRRTVTQPKVKEWEGPTSQFFWIDGGVGVEAVHLRTFVADFDTVSVGFLPGSGLGPMANIGTGLRLSFLTLGVRGRVASFSDSATVGDWQLWSLDAELGFRAPLGRIEPHLTFAAGYSSFGGFGTAISGIQDGIDVHGLDARLGFGVDYWLTHNLSIGANVDGGLLFIARPGVSVRDLATAKQIGTIDDAKARVLEASGSTVGYALAFTAGAGLHF
jgi:hypothetical protein